MADQTESSIEINASPAEIMTVIADLAAYPEWSDGITSVEVLSVYEEDGRPADARFHLDSGPIRDDYELEYDWDGDTEVTWKLTTGDMVTAMDGMYRLTPSGDSTTVLYRLAVDVKIPMLGMIKRKAEKVIVDTALKGLKERVESGATG
ncbi:SRPBCC family protein [Candidatus Nanopelagicales bacterium]|jgi:ribosome-associated toxin RatA of RatAB toxin-antitoxin module|nr:SRPBCC family protein [Candidatus Nanopelagicales bacterium]